MIQKLKEKGLLQVLLDTYHRGINILLFITNTKLKPTFIKTIEQTEDKIEKYRTFLKQSVSTQSNY